MTKKIFIITGETSGDLLAYKVIKNIITSNIEIEGIVGSNLKKLNINGPFESKDITFFGITDVIKNIFYIKKKINLAVQYIENFKPDIVFSVDSPDFVLQVIKKIRSNKKIKPKFFHYVAPSIWAWREKRANKIKKLLDKIYLLFEFEKKYFDKYSIVNDFVGHPFFEKFENNVNNYDADSNIITFCPGSRQSEIKIFMPIFLEIMNSFGSKYIYHFAITNSTHYSVQKYLKDIDKLKIIISSDENEKKKYFTKSLISIAKSGTISLDLCKSQIPFFTIYKFNWLNYLLIKPFVKVKFVNIVNIIANKEIIPEFIQANCNSKKIINHLHFLLSNKNELKKMIVDYNVILQGFSNKNTSEIIAQDLFNNLK